MVAGEEKLRRAFFAIRQPPTRGLTSAWFLSLSTTIGLPAKRVRSLFYDRRCRLWGAEEARILSALSRALSPTDEEIQAQLDQNHDLSERQKELEKLKGEMIGELKSEMAAIREELRAAVYGALAGMDRKAMHLG